MTTQQWLWAATGAAIAFAVAAGIAESRRNRRRSLDRPGWVPWRGLQAGAFFAAIALAILAAKTP
jgi:threonine/homoserine/homoserine lactone efflux protein